MVRGKLEGPVETVGVKGGRFHAKFAKGKREGDWVAGRAEKPERRAEELVRQNSR